MKHLTKLICFVFATLACGAAPEDPAGSLPMGVTNALPKGAAVTYDMPDYQDLATVDGLPGTPTMLSANGVPVIDGVERPDYKLGGINDREHRLARVTPDNPTGEYRWNIDDAPPADPSMVRSYADAEAFGFRNGQERYTFGVEHPDMLKAHLAAINTNGIGQTQQALTSNVFYGAAFTQSKNSDGTTNLVLKGACNTQENAGLDCEFPAAKNWTWAFDWAGCTIPAPPLGNGTFLGSENYIDPINWFQQSAVRWLPGFELDMAYDPNQPHIPDDADGLGNQVVVNCAPLSGTIFGAQFASSGPITDDPSYGAILQRRVTKASNRFPGCQLVSQTPGGGETSYFAKGLYVYYFAHITYDAYNMLARASACGADTSDPAVLENASINVFTHEIGHVVGLFHFPNGVMQQAGNCAQFYSQIRTMPQSLLQAVANFDPNGTEWHNAGDVTSGVDADSQVAQRCQQWGVDSRSPSLLGQPQADSTAKFTGQTESP